MQIETSVGEIVDKLSILHIKKEKISDEAKLGNITKEYEYLHQVVFTQLAIQEEDYDKLLAVNKVLWNIEDDIRVKEYQKEFDEQFIALARDIYTTNDKRAEIKKSINNKYNSTFVEEKSYVDYGNTH